MTKSNISRKLFIVPVEIIKTKSNRMNCINSIFEVLDFFSVKSRKEQEEVLRITRDLLKIEEPEL